MQQQIKRAWTPSAVAHPVATTLDRMSETETTMSSGPSTRYVRWVKPVIDRIVAGICLVIMLPVMAVVSALVFISLGGPIIFGQSRVGLGGKTFTVYKFRTMTKDRRAETPAYDDVDRRVTHKSPLDPRLTPTGKLLRKLSLDELPQLVNVLKGDMSLVGPRPELPQVIAQHYAPWQHQRHLVKPGITGLWQVSERGHGMMHEHVDVDLDYIEQVGLIFDLRILAKTVPAALSTNRGF